MIGHAHPYVRELMQAPRNIARRVDALIAGKER
jgi:hypothetical protein